MRNVTGRSKPRILLVGMPDSVHVGRWLEVHANEDLEVFIFPSSPMRKTHPLIQTIQSKGKSQNLIINFPRVLRFLAIPLWVLDRKFITDNRLRALIIARLICRLSPDLIHIMETQNGGYPVSRALNLLKNESRPKVLLTLFGSDLFWFGRFSEHKNRIRAVLKFVDYLAIECPRDERLARELGYSGTILPPIPVSAGIEHFAIAKEDNFASLDERKVIAIKGYGGRWGLGSNAVDSLLLLPRELLSDFKIVIFSVERAAFRSAKALKKNGFDVTVFRKFGLSHSEMLRVFAKSRLYIGLSRSDGLPASLLEAMSQGAFPIQTSTACLDGWIKDAENGYVLDDVDPRLLAKKIKSALQDDNLIMRAQHLNLGVIKERYSKTAIQHSSLSVYSKVLA